MPWKSRVARTLRGPLALDTDRAAAHGDYQAGSVASLCARYRARADGLDLRLTEQRVYSQNGEDGILCALILGLDLDPGTFVEFGVETGSQCCTRFLAEVLGWAGMYIEPDAAGYAQLAQRWAQTPRVATLQSTVTPDNVDALVATCDVLVIDVDGQDYWIWEASTIAPAVVVIEYNASHPELLEDRGTPWRPPHPLSGSGLEPLAALGARKGYRLVHTDATAVNAFFVRSDIDPGFTGITDRSPNHYGRGHN